MVKQKKQPTGPYAGTVKSTIRFPETLWREARMRAFEERKTFQDLVHAAVEAYLKRPKKKGGRQ